MEDGTSAIALAQLYLDPSEGLVLTNKSYDLFFHPIDLEQSCVTSMGQHVRLFRHEALVPEHFPNGYHESWQFDFGLHTDREWPEGPLLFTKWALPCDELLRYLGESALTTGWPNGVFTIELKDDAIIEFDIAAWDAHVKVMKASTWRVQRYDETTITPRLHVEIKYAGPVELHTVLDHEDSLRSFINWVWQMCLHAPKVALWNGTKHTALYRASQPQVFSRTHALVFRKGEVKKRFGDWFNAWLRIGPLELRSIRQVLAVYANQSLSIDLQYVMTYEAIVALAKTQGQEDSDGVVASHFVRAGQLTQEQAAQRAMHIRYTRNEILHLKPEPRAKVGDILQGVERTRALVQLDAVYRAMVLGLLGEPQHAINDYLMRVFKSIDTMALRYY